MFQLGGPHRRWHVGIAIIILALLAVASMQVRNANHNSAALIGPGPLAPSGAPVADKGKPGDNVVAAPMSGPTANGIIVGTSYKNDVSPPLRDIPPVLPERGTNKGEHENPPIPLLGHKD